MNISTNQHTLYGLLRQILFLSVVLRSPKLLFLPALIALALDSVAMADPGSPDGSFGTGGMVISPGNFFTNITTQPDGKIIAVGRTSLGSTDFVLVRFNTDGSLDNTFNGSGTVSTDFDGGNEICSSIAIQKDGKIVVAGMTFNFAARFFGIAVARYNQDGSLDNNFDGDGKLLLANLTTETVGYSLAIQEDEKIVIAGYYGITRLNSNGSVDNSFRAGTAGRFENYDIAVLSMALQPNGKILLAGHTGAGDFSALRLNTNGSPDSTFNGNGFVTTDLGGYEVAYCIAIQGDGKIVLGGEIRERYFASHPLFALARYNIDGSLDLTFNGNGKVTTDLGLDYTPSTDSYYYGIAVQQDGKLVMTGGSNGIFISRYNINGSLDTSFSDDGKVITNQQSANVFACVAVGNRLYVAGALTLGGGGFVTAYSLDNSVASGLSYKYYEGVWDKLPDFDSMIPRASGTTPSLNIGLRPSTINNNFAFLWEGYITITTPGMYTFETRSDDGSKFYFNNFYSPGATALVNNDGLHPLISATGTINIPAAGLYPVAISYFEREGGENMELYWTGPGINRQMVPGLVFTPKGPDKIPPSVSGNLNVVYKGRTMVKLDWENSTDNIGVTTYEVYANGFLASATSQSVATIENLSPNTVYDFTVKALDAAGNRSGSSATVSVTTISSGLDYKFYTNISYGSVGLETVSPTKTGVSGNVDISVRPQGQNENYAFIWQGYINIPVPGTYTFETISDDGSKFYFNMPYTDVAEALVNNFDNNGLHAPLSVKGSVNIPSAGLYPIAIRYNQYGGGQQMQFFWEGPGISRQPVPDAAFTDDSKPGFLVNGLNYKYYEGTWTKLPDFNDLTPVKAGTSANTDISLRPAGRNDHFAFLWEGYITVPTAGDYTFETVSDDGSRFYFNSLYDPTSTALVNNDGLHADASVKATVHIGTAGTYPIAISFFENTGDEKMEIYWSGPGITRQPIPTELLSPNRSMQINRLSYFYYKDYLAPWTMLPDFNTMLPDKTGHSPNIDISLGDPGRKDLFAFVWQGYINIPVPGSYTFETVSDDGSKFYFNSLYSPGIVANVNNDGVHASKSSTGTVDIGIPGVYPITVTFFEQYGDASMELYWSGPGIARQRVPNEAFTLVSPTAVPPPPLVFSNLNQKTNVVIPSAVAREPLVLNSVYPNPFNEYFTMEFYNQFSTNDITIGIYNLNGISVYANHAGKLPFGNNIVKINLTGIDIKDGVYLLQLRNNGNILKTVKMVKMKK